MKTIEEIKAACRNYEENDPRFRLYSISIDGEDFSQFKTRCTTAADMRERLAEIAGEDAMIASADEDYGMAIVGGTDIPSAQHVIEIYGA